jgi:hypothetical protein
LAAAAALLNSFPQERHFQTVGLGVGSAMWNMAMKNQNMGFRLLDRLHLR